MTDDGRITRVPFFISSTHIYSIDWHLFWEPCCMHHSWESFHLPFKRPSENTENWAFTPREWGISGLRRQTYRRKTQQKLVQFQKSAGYKYAHTDTEILFEKKEKSALEWLKNTWKALKLKAIWNLCVFAKAFRLLCATVYGKLLRIRTRKEDMERIWKKNRCKTERLNLHVSAEQSRADRKGSLRAARLQSKQVFVLLSGWSHAVSTTAFETWDNVARYPAFDVEIDW